VSAAADVEFLNAICVSLAVPVVGIEPHVDLAWRLWPIG
jgi:hypothetical protein